MANGNGPAPGEMPSPAQLDAMVEDESLVEFVRQRYADKIQFEQEKQRWMTT